MIDEEDTVNPDTNRFESLREFDELIEEAGKEPHQGDKEKARRLAQTLAAQDKTLVRPDGTPVPKTWTTFAMGEHVVIKGYTFKVAYIGETSILFEPVGVPELEPGKDG